MADKHLLRISELAAKSNVTPRTIRFYVQEGLLPQPIKSHKTLALYKEDCIEKIKAIKLAQTERFLPLVVIRRILEQKKDIDDYYSRRMPFFLKWLWPNVYYFYGISLIQLQNFDIALKILKRGWKYRAMAPYSIRLEDGILQAKRSENLQ